MNKEYHKRDWSKYDEALVQRGSITLWISKEAISLWFSNKPKKKGRPEKYSNVAIETMLIVKAVFKLDNRRTEGFIKSIFDILKLDLPVPDHTTISRRGRKLNIQLPKTSSKNIHLVIDSTGIKVYGDGEWKAFKHGREKRTKWIKMHLGVDAQTGQIQAVEITDEKVHDSKVVKNLLKQVGKDVALVIADGAYDTREVYDSIREHSPYAKVVIPPRKNALIWHGKVKGGHIHPRDENLRVIRKLGKKKWKEIFRYGIRSRVENVFYRIKRLFGNCVSSRLDEMRRIELLVWCKVLSIMDMLYVAKSYAC